MKNVVIATTAVIGVGVLSASLSAPVIAGCGSIDPQATPPARQQPHLREGQGRLISTAFYQVWDEPSDDEWIQKAPIVGLWKFSMVSEGSTGMGAPPNGIEIDFGLSAWHSDGTELMNSGAHAPITSNFCMGAWERTGRHTYVLNHYALVWDSAGTSYVGPANIRESVTVADSGNSYQGTFTIQQYSTDGTTAIGPHVAGTLTATRITAN
jgi:hypothetical protein